MNKRVTGLILAVALVATTWHFVNAGGPPNYGGQANLANATGTLAIGNGGTGATSLANHGVVTAGASALSVVAPGANGNILLSNGTDWTSAANTAGAPFADNAALVKNNGDNTKLGIFDVSLVTTGTTRTYKFPDSSSSIVVGPSAGPITLTGTTAARSVAVPVDAAFTLARQDAAQTFSGLQTFANIATLPVNGAPNTFGSATTADALADTIFASSSVSQKPIVIQAIASQAADLLDITTKDGAGHELFTIDKNGIEKAYLRGWATGQTPASGSGDSVEILGGIIQSYNRTTAAFTALRIDGLTLQLNPNNTAAGSIQAFSSIVQPAGGGTNTHKSNGLINSQVNSLGNGADTTEDDMHTFTLTASSFNTNGQVLRYHSYGTFTSTTNAQTVRVYVGGVLVGTITATASLSAQWDANVALSRTGASTQWASFTATTDATAGTSTTVTTGTSLSFTDTNTCIIKTTAQEGTAGTANHITEKGFHIYFDNY